MNGRRGAASMDRMLFLAAAILSLFLLSLKIADVVTSWAWVFAPLWLYLAIRVLDTILYFVLCALYPGAVRRAELRRMMSERPVNRR